MGVWECGSMGVWEYGSVEVLLTMTITNNYHSHTPILPYLPMLPNHCRCRADPENFPASW
jgi:hypothetical protein